MGGYWSMRITSIRLIDGTKNFQSIIGALYYLDLAISGLEMRGIKAGKKWIDIIKHLFNVRTSKKEQDITKYDNYIYSIFNSFVKQKRKLKFNIYRLSGCNRDFRNVIMGKFVKFDGSIKSMVNDRDNANLPKKELFTIFDNVDEMELNLYHPDYLYPISLVSLLSIIKSNPSLQKVVRIILGYYKDESKIRSLYSISRDCDFDSKIQTAYQNAGYSIIYYDLYCYIKKRV